MKRTLLMSAIAAGIALAANPATAVQLNAEGVGQVLLFPYYTVTAGQQTLISMVNGSDTAKVVSVRIREGYNSRDVLDFHVFMSPYDVWTASIFALSDAGLTGDGAAITTSDRNCVAPSFANWTGTLPGNRPYQQFLNFAYTGTNNDTAPQTNARTREGHIDLVELASFAAGGELEDAVTHMDGVPRNCAAVQGLTSAHAELRPPTGGLLGAGAIVNVAQGTFFTYNADALDGFSERVLLTGTPSVIDELSRANNDVTTPGFVSAFVFDDGRLLEAVYPTTPNNRAVDAVSAIFMAESVLNEYNVDPAAGSNTDWVVTFPTKRFYTDPQFIGSTSPGVAPFNYRFGSFVAGQNGPGQSCTEIDIDIFDREEATLVDPPIGVPPPGYYPTLCLATNVVSFIDTATPPVTTRVLGSTLIKNIRPFATAGWLRLDLSPLSQQHQMLPDVDGNRFQGLPVNGFAAVNYVNSNVTAGVLANYSGAFRHRTTRECTNTTACN